MRAQMPEFEIQMLNVCKRRWGTWVFGWACACVWIVCSFSIVFSLSRLVQTKNYTICWLISEMEIGIFSIFILQTWFSFTEGRNERKKLKGNISNLFIFDSKENQRTNLSVGSFVINAIKHTMALLFEHFPIFSFFVYLNSGLSTNPIFEYH